MFIHTYETPAPVISQFDTEVCLWYVAAFKQMTKVDEVVEMKKWCWQTFGTPEHNHLTFQTRWKDSIEYGEVYFSRKQDLEWFVLKWQ